VYTGAQVLLAGDFRKQVPQPRSLGVIERIAQLVLMLSDDLPDLPKRRIPCGRETKRVRAPILGAWVTLDEPLFFEIVEYQHKPARKCAKTVGELPLCHVGLRGEIPQNPGVGRRKPQRRQSLGKACGSVRADLREEESETGRPVFLIFGS